MDHELIEIAKRIRPYLPELVGPDDAPRYDGELAAILTDMQPPDLAEERIDRVLHEHPALLAWTAATLEDPDLRPPVRYGYTERGVDSGLGDGETVDAERFDCPSGDYTWYRLSVGYAVPRCPTHDLALVIA
jgi:hypothetical protein